MKFRTFRNLFKEAVRSIFRNRVMSFASVIAIMSALLILGVVLMLVFNLENVADGLENKVEVTLFLDKSLADSQSRAVAKQVENINGVYEVEYICKEEGLAKWKEDLGEKGDLLNGYEGDTNPLPDKIILKIERPEYVEDVIWKVNNISEIDKVNYSREVVDTIDKIVWIVRLSGLVLVAMLFIIAVIIINNTIKITVYSRRREIMIMKYIGATESYIRWPFIIEGFTLGIFAALLSAGLVLGSYGLLLDKSGHILGGESFLSLFELLPVERMMYDIGLVFLLVGCGVGIIASVFSIRKHLKV